MAFYYLSFCDPALPAGKQFLGNTVIEADDEYAISATATKMGRNPGGEIAFVKLEGVASRDDLPEGGRMYYDRFVPRDEALAEPHTTSGDDPDIRDGTICQSCND